MKGIAQNEFGSADVLSVQDLPDPLVGPDSVLIRVRAAGVNPVDYKIREGYLKGLLPHYFPIVPGWDVAGVVEATGPAAAGGLRPGDEVVAYARKDYVQHGTYAELVAVPDRGVARKPASLDFAHAAGLPLAGLTALQALRAAEVGEGATVLVHAASGGVGHLAVQIARALGAGRVIGTASEGNHDFLRSLGAEPVRYGDGLPDRLAALVGGDGRVDAALDFVGGQALEQSPELVRDPARVVSIVDPSVLARGGRYVFVRPDAAQLGWLGELADAGRLRVEVQRTFALGDAAEAHRTLEGGHVRGKLVLTV
ncbi:NADP-dependent oxidoreductase [Gandjariella thermophila]|uniref:Oxidoreductase n=1 Tax=Gandjariella thermophila TaxID=1931992 RepID=A0A4D4JF23_9PSEU|nr:NADP-dependent oxidoreductase [Gandjariella thermophila]GDY33620.1 oxidoreductase [Gandjariella thermophila]